MRDNNDSSTRKDKSRVSVVWCRKETAAPLSPTSIREARGKDEACSTTLMTVWEMTMTKQKVMTAAYHTSISLR
ncbi:hypothetical protein E2C01_076454 [Portunus trituberculatus]|uniref:Uncharacterized protein n=1 Tax=Portunus trituberculatus TaxID=210409 RepID=A0A5B7IIW3_PORTR|nr:hypothetical protein [Portunus trituberculatus]